MLEVEALYFPRADLLGDPHEGSLPRVNAEARDALVDAVPGWVWAPGMNPERLSWITNVRAVFVSCWNLSEHESAALWTI